MTRGIRYTDECKQEAVNQVVSHGYSVLDISKRLGISNKSRYDWTKSSANLGTSKNKKAICEQR